jgi:L-lactate dehydrogenase complex protein LldF
VYPGPIGAILTPQLARLQRGTSLPWASSLCGACYEVCPVKIDIPSVLIHMRGRIVRETGSHRSERAAMKTLARAFASRPAYEAAQRALQLGRAPLGMRGLTQALPGPLRAWTRARDLPPIPRQTFRDWWRER